MTRFLLAALLAAGCAAPLGPLPGQRTSGECGVEQIWIYALGME